MRFSILTLFPEFFDSPLKCSLIGRAREKGIVAVDFVPLRDFGEGNYRAVDDKPYGGGAGMVMMPAVVERALTKLTGGADQLSLLEKDVAEYRSGRAGTQGTGDFGARGVGVPFVVFLSPQGRKLDAQMSRRLAAHPHVALLCGHYEGVDERAIEAFAHEEVSIGDFILTGGEPAAMVVLDSILRFVPGVVGEAASVEGDTFEKLHPEVMPGGLKAPVYTRPGVWRGREVPKELLSGNHAEISKWRRGQSEKRTSSRRPDLVGGTRPKPARKPVGTSKGRKSRK